MADNIKSIEQLYQTARLVKNATEENENSANRVGGLFEGIIDYLGYIDTSGGGGVTPSISLNTPLLEINSTGFGQPSANQVIGFNGSTWRYMTLPSIQQGLTDVSLTMPNGFTVNGSTSGTTKSFTVALGNSLSLLSAADKAKWDSLYNSLLIRSLAPLGVPSRDNNNYILLWDKSTNSWGYWPYVEGGGGSGEDNVLEGVQIPNYSNPENYTDLTIDGNKKVQLPVAGNQQYGLTQLGYTSVGQYRAVYGPVQHVIIPKIKLAGISIPIIEQAYIEGRDVDLSDQDHYWDIPAASNSAYGVVKLGYSTSGTNLAVQTDTNGSLYVDASSISGSGGGVAGVSSLNNTTGAVTLVAGSGTNISKSGQSITISSTGEENVIETITIPTGDGSSNGEMPINDKTAAFPPASSSQFGLVKLGYSTSGTNLAVQSSNGKLFVDASGISGGGISSGTKVSQSSPVAPTEDELYYDTTLNKLCIGNGTTRWRDNDGFTIRRKEGSTWQGVCVHVGNTAEMPKYLDLANDYDIGYSFYNTDINKMLYLMKINNYNVGSNQGYCYEYRWMTSDGYTGAISRHVMNNGSLSGETLAFASSVTLNTVFRIYYVVGGGSNVYLVDLKNGQSFEWDIYCVNFNGFYPMFEFRDTGRIFNVTTSYTDSPATSYALSSSQYVLKEIKCSSTTVDEDTKYIKTYTFNKPGSDDSATKIEVMESYISEP